MVGWDYQTVTKKNRLLGKHTMLSILTTIVAPVFSVIFIGIILGKSEILTKERTAGLVRFVTHVALPALLFRSLAQGIPESNHIHP